MQLKEIKTTGLVLQIDAQVRILCRRRCYCPTRSKTRRKPACTCSTGNVVPLLVRILWCFVTPAAVRC
jgi:hypothetical protein